jgi:hypothetical protein
VAQRNSLLKPAGEGGSFKPITSRSMSFKRLLPALLLLCSLSPFASAADRLKDFVMRTGETVYARFEVDGRKLKLVSASKSPDAAAQVVFTLTKNTEKKSVDLKAENKLPKDLIYRGEIRAPSHNLKAPARVTPVVGGKLAFENFPELVEEFSAFDFKLAK